MAFFHQSSYSVPYSSPLPFTLTDGKEIIITGVANHGAQGFLISLSVGRDHNTETPFVLNPRFNKNEVVRNHNINGWGSEEKHGGFPFQRGAHYEVKIIVRHHAYQVYVNNNYFCDFNHRLAKETVRHLYIEGETTISRISFLDTLHNPSVPYTTPIHGGLYPGRTFHVSGVPTGGSRFNVNLVCGTSVDHHDVAFCFDARFNFGNQHNLTIRNHKANGSWGTEEVHQPFFPFTPNVPFELTILVEHHGFKVTVNNQHFVDFNHRIHPYQRITHLNVTGDVRLSQVKI
uniref:Galectin n=1 Tax=Arion vulgaris TaxID=1028688 RepID=A0A0B6ZWE7_9EUPU